MGQSAHPDISEQDTTVRRRGAGLAAKVEAETPYTVQVVLRGECPMLFHRWDCDTIASKGRAKKNSAEKKTDNLESYVYRCPDGTLGVPGANLKASLVGAARYFQDPRSPRKSAQDLVKAGLFVVEDISSLGIDTWEFEDRRRAPVQRQGITRIRPGVKAGWRLEFMVRVLTPEYLGPSFLQEVLYRAGQLIGLCDFRPEFGRFRVEHFAVIEN